MTNPCSPLVGSMSPPVLPRLKEAGGLEESIGSGMLLPTRHDPALLQLYASWIPEFGGASLLIYSVSIH